MQIAIGFTFEFVMNFRKEETETLGMAAVAVTKTTKPCGIDIATKSLTTERGVLLVPAELLAYLPGDSSEIFILDVQLPGPHHPFGKRCLHCRVTMAGSPKVADGMAQVSVRVHAMAFQPTSRVFRAPLVLNPCMPRNGGGMLLV